VHGPEKLPGPVANISPGKCRGKALSATFIALCIFSSAAYFVHYKPVRGSHIVYRIFSDFKENKYKSFLPMLDDFNKALSLHTFGNTEIRLLMLNISSEILRNRTFAIEGAVQFVETTAEEANKLIADDFYNIEQRVTVVDLYHDIAVYEPSFITKAERLIRDTIRISPGNQWSYFALADNFILRKDYENAFLAVKKAVDINPDNEFVQLKLALGGILTSRNAIVKDALDNVKKLRLSRYAIMASGEEYYFKESEVLTFAKAAVEVKDYRQAVGFYKELISLSPKVAQYHFDLAEIYIMLGDRDNAVKEARQAVEFDPDFLDKIKEIVE